jgi:uncharacterized protein YecT (DUF1311 family)
MIKLVSRLLLRSALALALLHAPPALAQHMNAEGAPCQDAGSMVDIANCLNSAYAQADAELNATYRRIMAVLGAADKGRLREAQRAWIVYRGAACAAEAGPYEGGSGSGIARLACLEAATRQRTVFMKVGFWWRVEKFEG